MVVKFNTSKTKLWGASKRKRDSQKITSPFSASNVVKEKEIQVVQILDLFNKGNNFKIEPKEGILDETYTGIKERKNGKEIVLLKNSKGEDKFSAFKKAGCNLSIGIKLSKKIDPTARIFDPKTGLTILAADGELEFENWGVKLKAQHKNSPSFTGMLHVITGFRSKSVEDSVKNYFDSDKDFVVKGENYGKLNNDYNIIVSTQGNGTRLAGISSEDKNSEENGVNKAAVKLPAYNRSILHDIIDKSIGSGIIEKESSYYQFIKDSERIGDAFAIGKAFNDETIKINKPTIIAPSDHINNIDFSKALKDFESKDNCGMMMISVVLTPEEQKKNTYTSRLVCVDDNMQVKNSFKCKKGVYNNEEQLKEAKLKTGKYKGSFLSAIPIAIFHPKVLEKFKEITANYIDQKQQCFLGADVFPILQRVLNNNEIIFNGKPLKLYTTIAKTIEGRNAKDFDIGTFNLYAKTARAIAKGELPYFSPKLVEEYKKNVDSATGAVCLNETKDLFEQLKKTEILKKISGSIVITK